MMHLTQTIHSFVDPVTILPIGAGAAPAAFAIDLLKILACAGLVAAALGRLKIAVIPGYLIAGALIGPGAIGLIDNSESTGEITSVATVLLMFGIGLHLDTSALRQGALSIVSAGVLTTIGTFLITTPSAMAFGLEPPEAIAIGMVVSMSSTAVVMRLLQQKRELYSAHGRLSFGILLVQDLLVVVMLAMLPVVADMGQGSEVASSAAVAIDDAAEFGKPPPFWIAIIAVAVLIAVGKVALPRLMTVVANGRSEEVLLVVAAAVALGAAVLTGYVGLSPELGAFVAGFLLSSTPFRYQLSGQISPVRDLFMAIFFTAVGLKLDLSEIVPDLGIVLLVTGLILVIKTTVISAVAWGVGASMPIAVRSGLGLAQAGEFSLLLLATAGGLGIIEPQTASIMIAAIVLTLIVTPSLDTLGNAIAHRIMHLPAAPWFSEATLGSTAVLADLEGEDGEQCPVEVATPSRVIIAGFGPVGRACADRLEREGVRATIVELNPDTVRRQAALGRSIIYGDITNTEVLEKSGLDHAEAVLLTMPDHEAMLRAVSVVRRHRPDVYIAVRANLLSWANRAREMGANHVAVAEVAVAEHLAKHAMIVCREDEPEDQSS